MNNIPSGTPVAMPAGAYICPICHDDLYHPEYPDFYGRNVVIAKPCGHKFHINCLDLWIKDHLDCPLGKRAIEHLDVSMPLPAGWQDRMVDAAKEGDIGTLRALLNRGAEAGAGQADGRTPLAWATNNRHLDAALLLAGSGAADPVGQNNLGWMYERGQGVEQDYGEAVKWYRKAAEQGDVNASASLGWMYLNGEGVEQNDGEAVKWLRKAAEQGHAPSQNNLGWMYLNGQGVEQDYGEAVKWYRKATEQEHANAQQSLGLMYERGQGVEQDYGEAVKWYRKAAEQGHVNASASLGYMYDRGRGVEQDYGEAAKWYRKAAEQGHVPSLNKLGFLYKFGGPGMPDNPLKAFE